MIVFFEIAPTEKTNRSSDNRKSPARKNKSHDRDVLRLVSAHTNLTYSKYPRNLLSCRVGNTYSSEREEMKDGTIEAMSDALQPTKRAPTSVPMSMSVLSLSL